MALLPLPLLSLCRLAAGAPFEFFVFFHDSLIC